MLKNKYLKFIAKLVISLLFVGWLVLKIDWFQVLGYMGKISLLQIVLYFAVLILGIVVSAYKWKILADFKGFRNPFSEYFQLYLAGTFINNFLPSFVGGDTYKAYQIGKKEKKYIPAAASVVVDRITGLFGAMILSVLFAVLNWQVIANQRVLYLVFGVVFLLLVFFAVFIACKKIPFWKKIASYLPEKIIEIVEDFVEYKKDAKVYSSVMILSIAFNMAGVAMANYVLFWGLGININILDYLTVIFLISIISSIPVSINNIGIKEWAYVTFFGFFGLASSGVIAVALLSRVLQMVLSFVALPYYLRNKAR